MYKKLSASRGLRPPDPHQGLCPWTPLGAPPPDPRLGSRSAHSPWSASSPFGKSWIRHCSTSNTKIQDWQGGGTATIFNILTYLNARTSDHVTNVFSPAHR